MHTPEQVPIVDLHQPNGRGRVEVEAESVAFLVSAAHGLDTSSFTFPYVGGWMPRKDNLETTLRDTAARVLGTAHGILERLDRDKPDLAIPAEDRPAAPHDSTAPALAWPRVWRDRCLEPQRIPPGHPTSPTGESGAMSSPALTESGPRTASDRIPQDVGVTSPGGSSRSTGRRSTRTRETGTSSSRPAPGRRSPTPAPVREHVDQLRDAGMTSEQIAHASGVSVSTLTRLFKVTRMTTTAAEAILAITPPRRAQRAAASRTRPGSCRPWSPTDGPSSSSPPPPGSATEPSGRPCTATPRPRRAPPPPSTSSTKQSKWRTRRQHRRRPLPPARRTQRLGTHHRPSRPRLRSSWSTRWPSTAPSTATASRCSPRSSRPRYAGSPAPTPTTRSAAASASPPAPLPVTASAKDYPPTHRCRPSTDPPDEPEVLGRGGVASGSDSPGTV